MLWGPRKQGLARRWSLVAAFAAILASAGGGASALAAGSPARVRVGGPPVAGRAARDIGGVATATRMRVTLILKARDQAALAAYARQVSTPGSSVYHAYLAPTQFGQRFGATAAQLRAVERSMRSHGLTPGAVASNRLSVPVSGTAGQIERAFALSFRRRAARNGTVAVVASAAPALDAGIAGDVQAVLGLGSVSAPRPLLARPSALDDGIALRPRLGGHAASGAATPCQQASMTAAAQEAYTADQIAVAYGFSGLYASGAEGQGQTIAVYELESYDPGDIAAYEACYGIGASVTNVPVDGGPGTSGPGSGEAALDIENAIGLAPKAKLLVYEGPNGNSDTPGSGPYDTLDAIVSQDRADVVSISWGECEQLQGSSSVSAENVLFEEAATQGQSVVSATGDEGSEDCNGVNTLPDFEQAADDPGSQPFVTGVGGTSLSAVGPPPNETVWNRAGPSSGPFSAQGGAGGGGVSHAWQMPGYQRNAARSLHVIGPGSSGSPCANVGAYCREVPDVAADADPSAGYIFYWNGAGTDPTSPQGWQAVGGTSAGAPLWAALLADADSSSACHGSAIGFANPALYAAAAGAYTSYFNDITVGNNDYTGTNGGFYPAGPAYDMASGLGTPNAAALAAALCANSLRVNNPGTQVSTLGHAVKLQTTTSALPGAKVSYYASQLPPGLSISRSSGRITGKPKRIGTWSVGIAALDQNLSLRAAFFTWKVGGAPSVSQTSLSGVGSGRPTLALTVTAGRAAPALKQITIAVSNGLSFGRPGHNIVVLGSRGRRLAVFSRVVHGRLQIPLVGAASRIRVTIRYSAIRASGGLAAAVRGHRRPALTVAVETVDTAKHGVGEQARVRPRG
jgi:subtilase family serine protease